MSIACPDCGAVQEVPPLPPRGMAECRLCERELEKTSGRSVSATLAFSFSTLLLLIPANTLPLIRLDVFGMRETNVIWAGISALWDHQWVVLSAFTALFVIVVPFIRFGLLTLALAAIRFGRHPRWLGPVYRWAIWLDPWGMSDVFLLASFVGFYRLIHLSQANVSIQMGGYAFMAAGFLTMLSRATLDRRTVWRYVGPEVEPDEGEWTSCTTCDLLQPASREGHPCPRCGARLKTRKLDAVPRSAALLVTAFALFFPANFLPMEISTRLGNHVNYTIFTGIREMFRSGLWPLGGLVFCTSILIPIGKIVAMGWCVLSVWRGSSARLVAKTKVFRLIAELGRWSKTDPFTIVFFVPLMHFGVFASADAGWGATAFVMMTFLTMVASSTFDPRLMWDAGLPRSR